MYGIWSTGLGLDADFALAIMLSTSSAVKLLVTIGTVGGGGFGIHEGHVKDFDEAE